MDGFWLRLKTRPEKLDLQFYTQTVSYSHETNMDRTKMGQVYFDTIQISINSILVFSSTKQTSFRVHLYCKLLQFTTKILFIFPFLDLQYRFSRYIISQYAMQIYGIHFFFFFKKKSYQNKLIMQINTWDDEQKEKKIKEVTFTNKLKENHKY